MWARTVQDDGVSDFKKVSEVCAELGVTRMQLRHWDDLGLVPPQFIGSHRVYDENDRKRVAIVKQLVNAGFRASSLRDHLRLQGELPPRNETEIEFFKRALVEAKDDWVALDVKSVREYNTTYKAVRRIAKGMGLNPHLRKVGDQLLLKSTG